MSLRCWLGIHRFRRFRAERREGLRCERCGETALLPSIPPLPPLMNVIQPWVWKVPMMQQTVLLAAIRGPDGTPKYSRSKYILRWYRRCLLLFAMDQKVLDHPGTPGRRLLYRPGLFPPGFLRELGG